MITKITSVTINYEDSALDVLLDNGIAFELAFTEIQKLTSAMSTSSAMPGFNNMRRADSLFSPGIKAALDGKIINYTEALMIVDYTNRGFANPSNTVSPNLLKDQFPEYVAFLEHFRTATGDPNAV